METDVIADAKREVDEAIAAAQSQAGKTGEAEGAAAGTPEGQPQGGSEGKPAEGAKPQGDGAGKPEGEGQDGAKPAGSDAGQPRTIPMPRFAKVVSRLRETELENARLKGQLEGRDAKPADDKGSPKKPEDLIADIDTEIDKLAEKFDAGEIKLAEFKRRERELEAQKREITQAATQPEEVRDLYLEEKTQELENRFNWIGEVSQKHLDAFGPLAIDLMRDRKLAVDDSPASQLAFRQHLVAVAIAHGVPAMYGWSKGEDGAWTKGGKPAARMPGAPPAGDGKPPQRTGVTPEQRKAKAELASEQPPSPGIGRPAAAQTDPTDADMAKMTDEEIAALPAATRDRLAKRA